MFAAAHVAAKAVDAGANSSPAAKKSVRTGATNDRRGSKTLFRLRVRPAPSQLILTT